VFKRILERTLDIFFSPTEVEKILRKISIETLYKKCEKELSVNSNDVFSIFKYKDPFIKDAIYELKNNKNSYAISLFSQLLFEEIFNYLEENLIQSDYKIPITWVPQYKDTYLNKGYNQAEELAAALCAAAPSIFEKKNLLKKIRKTKPQHEIKNRKARLKNLKGAFCLEKSKKGEVKSKIIILIDDVYTTGATLEESRRVLLKSGALKVVCFTVAH
jgi:competence protein ComFC